MIIIFNNHYYLLFHHYLLHIIISVRIRISARHPLIRFALRVCIFLRNHSSYRNASVQSALDRTFLWLQNADDRFTDDQPGSQIIRLIFFQGGSLFLLPFETRYAFEGQIFLQISEIWAFLVFALVK